MGPRRAPHQPPRHLRSTRELRTTSSSRIPPGRWDRAGGYAAGFPGSANLRLGAFDVWFLQMSAGGYSSLFQQSADTEIGVPRKGTGRRVVKSYDFQSGVAT